jgi:hypothetical protein
MRHPAYHLRTNKAIDRFMLLEALRHLVQPNDQRKYTYYGFGGPYLEDFRLVHENFPRMHLVSLESDPETYKRQKFHAPCRKIRLVPLDFRSFLARYDSRDRKSIFWLDYTGLEYSQVEDFMSLLGKVARGSVIKVTLRAEPSDFLQEEQEDDFKEKFAAVLPSSDVAVPHESERLACLLQDIMRIAAQQALPSAMGVVYQPISSFYYKDGDGIFTLAGAVCARDGLARARALFSDWPFANLDWGKPRRIDVPFLSTKERLHLQRHLPCARDAGSRLHDVLKYSIDDDRESALGKMAQYADFYNYYPYFMKAIP